MTRCHIVRYSKRQAYFDTPTVGHFSVPAASAQAAVRAVRAVFEAHNMTDVTVTYIAPGPVVPTW